MKKLLLLSITILMCLFSNAQGFNIEKIGEYSYNNRVVTTIFGVDGFLNNTTNNNINYFISFYSNDKISFDDIEKFKLSFELEYDINLSKIELDNNLIFENNKNGNNFKIMCYNKSSNFYNLCYTITNDSIKNIKSNDVLNLSGEKFTIYNNHGDIGITTHDNKGYIISEINGTPKQLYDKAKLYVSSLMVNPESSIVSDDDGVLLKWTIYTQISNDYNYHITYVSTIFFKDNKIKIQFYLTEVKNLYTLSNTWLYIKYDKNSSYNAIYKQDGINFSKFGELKLLLEQYFDIKSNDIILNLLINNNDSW